MVLADPLLQRELRSLPSRADFVRRAAELAAQLGCDDVTQADIEEALVASRRAWLERWI